MRGKRSKQYRKLMQQYGMTFGFREPFQVLLDAGIIQDAARFKMDLVGSLKRTLHGEVKPMITQCSIRHLYNASLDQSLVDEAKTYERRRCNHHTLEKPLSTLECLSSVVDPRSSGTNKHRYVVASQDGEARAFMRNVAGVPLVYINRSVMIMEPMAGATERVRELEERVKFRAGLKSKRGGQAGVKRKRDPEGESGSENRTTEGGGGYEAPKRRKRGPKGPNPLSTKKPKRNYPAEQAQATNREIDSHRDIDKQPEPSLRKRRNRKHGLARDNRPTIDTSGEMTGEA
ncbi:hypothetical protein FGG08_001379 [Glutinoglossum americanum]|uniref:U three protein 23 n=1 Tax=Glutinoglossum americanum TaxID=1670608 RepID=A0A9P8L2T8_9PEZI|nr:hypothetical protein FGG08_001379 [Glutinoglossum americanum]